MNQRQQLAALNKLLIDLGRSLLQYVYEAWPWVDADSEAAREEVYDLAERQADAVAAIADYLGRHNWPIDFGIYPVEFTDLHYVSLDFLLGLASRNADELLTDVHETRRLLDDPEAAELISNVEREQQLIAERLRELAAAVKQPEPA